MLDVEVYCSVPIYRNLVLKPPRRRENSYLLGMVPGQLNIMDVLGTSVKEMV